MLELVTLTVSQSQRHSQAVERLILPAACRITASRPYRCPTRSRIMILVDRGQSHLPGVAQAGPCSLASALPYSISLCIQAFVRICPRAHRSEAGPNAGAGGSGRAVATECPASAPPLASSRPRTYVKSRGKAALAPGWHVGTTPAPSMGSRKCDQYRLRQHRPSDGRSAA